jgi:hypothetical protein
MMKNRIQNRVTEGRDRREDLGMMVGKIVERDWSWPEEDLLDQLEESMGW